MRAVTTDYKQRVLISNPFVRLANFLPINYSRTKKIVIHRYKNDRTGLVMFKRFHSAVRDFIRSNSRMDRLRRNLSVILFCPHVQSIISAAIRLQIAN